MRVIGSISILLLFLMILLQGLWLKQFKEAKLNKLQETTTYVLEECVKKYISNKSLEPDLGVTCSLDSDRKTFKWKGRKEMLSGYEEFLPMALKVIYDNLYENRYLDLNELKNKYKKDLSAKKINGLIDIILKDRNGQQLLTSDSCGDYRNIIWTDSIPVGYDYRHYISATIEMPKTYQLLERFWILISLFFIGFVGCLLWQLIITKGYLQRAKVQSMGIAHLKHELRKPLHAAVQILGNITNKPQEEWTQENYQELNIVRDYLERIETTANTMLYSLENNRITINREPVDVHTELKRCVDIYQNTLYRNAKINYSIDDEIGMVNLDKTYFLCVVRNLIDNGIKYNKNRSPEIHIEFQKDNGYWTLTVTDNGIGIPQRKIKQIFKTFYHIEQSDITYKTGFGLGLTFVKKVTDAYKGEIQVRSSRQGSKFIIKWPISTL